MADTKVTALTENTTPALTDIMYIVDDPGGSAASQKVTLTNIKAALGFPTFSGAALTKSAVQAVDSASETAITFDGEVYDTDSYHDNSTNPSRFTAPVTGYYLVGGSAELVSVADGKYVILRIRKGGANADGDGRTRIYTASADTYLGSFMSRVVQLNATQYVELTVEHNHGSARNVRESSNGTSFWIMRIG